MWAIWLFLFFLGCYGWESPPVLSLLSMQLSGLSNEVTKSVLPEMMVADEMTRSEKSLHAPSYCQGDIDFSTIECIFSDMDGTLLHSNHRVSDRTINAIKSVKMKGKLFFPATGRNRRSFAAVIDKKFLELYGDKIDHVPGVFSQGLIVYGMNGELIHEEYLDYQLVREVEDYLHRHDINYVAYSGDRVFTSRWGDYIKEITKYKDPIPEFISESLTKLKYLGLKINKIILLAEESMIAQHRPKLETIFRRKVSFTRAVAGMLEILPFGSSKGKGVQKFLEYHQIPPSKVLAFGDAENDLEMIQFVKYGIAMKNGKEELFSYAFRRSHFTNEEDGVAHILEHIE